MVELKRKRLRDLVEIQSGYQTRRKVMEDPFGSHRLLQARDIRDSKINWQGALCINPEGDPLRYLIRPQDILFIARGYENRAYFMPEAPESLLASTSFHIIRVTSPLLVPGFLGWWLNEREAQAYFGQFQVKMGFAYMSKKNLLNLKVPIPDKNTQTRISDVLQLWQKEQQLVSKISEAKEKIITSILLSAINEKES